MLKFITFAPLLVNHNLFNNKMKNVVKLIAVVVILAVATSASAQKNSKLGHIDFGKLIEQMPGQDTVKLSMNSYAQTLQDTYMAMQNELQTKIDEYTRNKETMSAIIKQTKEKEIGDLQARMETFQQSAQQDLADQETKLTTPFIDKARKAIQEVAKENGFTYIFNNVEGLLLYNEGGEDIMPLVKKKMGIQ